MANRKDAPKQPDDFAVRIRRYAANGVSLDEVALLEGTSPSSIDRWLAANPEAKLQHRLGKIEAGNEVAGRLWKKIRQNDLGAIIFYLKCQRRWSTEKANNEEERANGGTSIRVDYGHSSPPDPATIERLIRIAKGESVEPLPGKETEPTVEVVPESTSSAADDGSRPGASE